MAQAPVTPADRLSFTLFLAVVVHATLIFGIGFQPQRPSAAAPSVDVTIVHHQSERAPDEADFIAQAHQEASGDQIDRKELTTDQEADFADQQIDRVQPIAPSVIQRTEQVTQRLVVTTQGVSPRQVHAREQQETEARPAPQAEHESLEEMSREIASLQARLDAQRQAYAKRPRIRRLTSVSATAHYEAIYLDAFRREVEEMGTRHFPDEALSRDQFGNVRLAVSLRPDGTVHGIEITQSSGYRFLDEAAVRSVRLAAPFAPFTEEMRRNTDILEIIRTWRFDRRQIVTSH